MKRIQGATIPGHRLTFSDATDGTGFTWKCQASLAAFPLSQVWSKTTGFTADATGADVVWEPTDMGALAPGRYVLEFTGTGPAGVIKHREDLEISAEIPI